MKAYLRNNFDFTKLVDVFDELPLWSAPFGLKLLDAVDYKPNISALDIGFGTGFPLTEIAMRLGPGATVFGIDPWKEAIGRVRKKVDYYGLSNVKLIEGVAESIPLPDTSIDLLVSNNGINNVADMDQVLSECARIARKGAQFVLTMNLDLSMFEFYHVLEAVLTERGMEASVEQMRQHIAHKRPPLNGVLNLLQRHDWTIRRAEHHQFQYKFADGTALLHHYFIRLAFMDAWLGVLPADEADAVFGAIEARLNERAAAFGGITLSIPYVLIDAVKLT